jgi:hypothetical protein
VISKPAKVELADDLTVHYLSPVAEYQGRWLRVVTLVERERIRVVTVFFDRRVARRHP